MDVTYAVVNKARRGGGAGGRGHAPSAERGHAPAAERGHAPSAERGHAPAPDSAPAPGRDHAPSAGRDPAPAGDHAPSPGRDHAPRGFGSAPSSLPGSPLRRRPSPSPAASPDGAYEVVTPRGDPGSPPRLGFNFRIGKPKGPREPPAEWSRV